jgi:nucleotide-binding universal stress UspA family protein
MMQEAINNAVECLVLLKAAIFPHGSDVDTVAYAGRPAPTIVARANAGGFDLIVMGTHHRGGLSPMFMGSVADQVVRTASCAVLTVRARGAARAHRPAPAKAA